MCLGLQPLPPHQWGSVGSFSYPRQDALLGSMQESPITITQVSGAGPEAQSRDDMVGGGAWRPEVGEEQAQRGRKQKQRNQSGWTGAARWDQVNMAVVRRGLSWEVAGVLEFQCQVEVRPRW